MPEDMVDPEGRPVNAVYGFARFLGDLLESARPRYVGVAFDESLKDSFRNQIYPPYKANREPPPLALVEQFARCRQLCLPLGLTAHSSDQFEADDIIGTWTEQARRQGHPVVVVTKDKDLSQLIRPGDVFWDFSGSQRYAYDDIATRFGAVPERMADYLALTGDAVDNIPGVPGIGPKTATQLLESFSDLESIYQNLEAVSGLPLRGAARVHAKLLEHRDKAFQASELTRVFCEAPLPDEAQALARRKPDLSDLDALYSQAGFGTALRRQAERFSAHAYWSE